MRHGPGPPGLRNLRVAMPLRDGGWLTFATALPESGASFSRQFIIAMFVMALIIVAVSVWAVRRMTRPLASLAAAAERLGRDGQAPPLPETGTVETVQAARAFNAMQVRLRALIDNRTRLFSAVSHDLRTPLTLLRLRAENVENREERDRMVATIAEMDAMIGAALSYARDDASGEPSRPTDLTALTQSIVDDLAATGMPVTLDPPAGPAVRDCRPPALKRALVNLIDNAVKYGKAARVSVASEAGGVTIAVDDDGPGIPEAEIARVFEPFYRVEASRSRDTGGVGLGLAIAKSIVESHGGTLVLRNRSGGGLRAEVALPKQ
jgi:signal transduction histidine kinase